MTDCTTPACRRRTAALHQLVSLLSPDRDQREAYMALDAALSSAEAALVGPEPEPETIRCRRCGEDKPIEEYSFTGAGRKKTCPPCHGIAVQEGMAAAKARKARRLDGPTGKPVVAHGPKLPSNGGR